MMTDSAPPSSSTSSTSVSITPVLSPVLDLTRENAFFDRPVPTFLEDLYNAMQDYLSDSFDNLEKAIYVQTIKKEAQKRTGRKAAQTDKDKEKEEDAKLRIGKAIDAFFESTLQQLEAGYPAFEAQVIGKICKIPAGIKLPSEEKNNGNEKANNLYNLEEDLALQNEILQLRLKLVSTIRHQRQRVAQIEELRNDKELLSQYIDFLSYENNSVERQVETVLKQKTQLHQLHETLLQQTQNVFKEDGEAFIQALPSQNNDKETKETSDHTHSSNTATTHLTQTSSSSSSSSSTTDNSSTSSNTKAAADEMTISEDVAADLF